MFATKYWRQYTRAKLFPQHSHPSQRESSQHHVGQRQKTASLVRTRAKLVLMSMQIATSPKRNRTWFSPISTLSLDTSPTKNQASFSPISKLACKYKETTYKHTESYHPRTREKLIMSFEHHAFKWKKPNLHASISVLIVFTQAICRRPRQSWKGIHPEGCFRATDYGALGPATMPIRIGYNKKQILLEADHSFIYLPKKKPNVVLQSARWP